jgi:hypothetical protein
LRNTRKTFLRKIGGGAPSTELLLKKKRLKFLQPALGEKKKNEENQQDYT